MRPPELYPLFANVRSLKGVGQRIAGLLERVAGERVLDLLFLAPGALIVRRATSVAGAREGETATVRVQIDGHDRPARPSAPWRIRAHDASGALTLAFFKGHGPHLERAHPVGAERLASGRIDLDRYGGGLQMAHPDYLVSPDRAEEIPEHEAVYPATAGLPSRAVRRFVREALACAPATPEWLDPAFLAAQRWPAWREALARLHAPASDADLGLHAPHRRRLAFDELLAHQLALAQRKARVRADPAPRIARGRLAEQAQDALPWRLTGAQSAALADIRGDFAQGRKMSRLIQGDVGSGKTIVAMLAMLDVAGAGLQSALMAPTEVLARQHFATLAGPLAAQGVLAVLLTGRDRGAARTAKLAQLADGRAAVAIGTHALFQDDVAFADLAFTVIDEQHRFGVGERMRLQGKSGGAHMLAMSATPIPRTLELTLYGDLDVSRLTEKPPGRRPIATRAAPMPRLPEIVARLKTAIADGAQAFWICPLVAESEVLDLAAAESRAAALRAQFGERVGLVHGRLTPPLKDEVMAGFVDGRLRVLVATTVVEVGVDVPSATIMIIEQAERFGLAQLHQLRGRVGRGRADSACVLLYDPPLSDLARRRLDILRRTDDGFEIAEKDLELRGGGDPLGLAQSGFPAYRLADPAAHLDLIAAAADDARLVLARDPDFASERGRALLTLQSLFDWRPGSPLGRAG